MSRRTKLDLAGTRALVKALCEVINMASQGTIVPGVRDAVRAVAVHHGAKPVLAARLRVHVRPNSRRPGEGRRVSVDGLHEVFEAPRNSGLPLSMSMRSIHGRG